MRSGNNDQPTYGSAADDYILPIFNAITNFDDFVALSQTCLQYRNIATDKSNKHFLFFKKHFEYHSAIKQFLRSTEQLALINLRTGNYLATKAIELLLDTHDDNAQSLLLVAAYWHGSPIAMRLLNMLGTLPGKISTPIFETCLIQKYRDKLANILQNTYQEHYPATEWSQCDQLVTMHLTYLDASTKMFIEQYKKFYVSQRGISTSNSSLLEETVRGLDYRIYNELCEKFNLGNTTESADFNRAFHINLVTCFRFSPTLLIPDDHWLHSTQPLLDELMHQELDFQTEVQNQTGKMEKYYFAAKR